MQLVIDMPDEVYNKVLEEQQIPCRLYIEYCIIHDTPLPKGHGRLIDADKLKSMASINRANFNTVIGIQKWIDDEITIIEADMERSEGCKMIVKEVNHAEIKPE